MRANKFIHFYKALLPLGAMLFLLSCEQESTNTVGDTGFDRVALLTHYEENIISPNVESLTDAAEDLQSAIAQAVANSTDASALQNARDAWKSAALAYANCHSFNFGPGETFFGSFAENVATFPTNAQKTQGYIAAGDYSLNNFDRDTRGLYGMEYLLFVQGAQDSLNNTNYAAYLQAIAVDFTTRCNELKTGWNLYGAAFKQDPGTGSSSSITVMYNEWLKGYEHIKNFMVGIPAGTRAGQTGPEPNQVAGLYSGFSQELLQAYLNHIEVMYFGERYGANMQAPGFDDYLKTTVGGEDVYTQTVMQWQKVRQAESALPDAPLNEAVQTHLSDVENLYTELSRHTRFFKSELASRLGLTITYDSGDGD